MPAPEPWPTQPIASLGTSIRRYYRAFVVRTLIYLILLRRRFLRPIPYQPTLTKAYPHLPRLKHRIFYPATYDRTNPDRERLPIYIDFHGGGYVLGDAALDDDFCRPFADKHGFLVVSIEYALAPASHFPNLVFDITSSVEAVLTDPDIRYDPDRIVLGGFSAGGTAAFTTVQLLIARYRIRALVGYYTCLDMHTHTEQKMLNRTQRSQDRPDDLARAAPLLTWAFIRPGQNLKEPLLSPIFGDPDRFPRAIYLVSAEYDILSYECQFFAEKIATANRERARANGLEPAKRREMNGGSETGDGWVEGSVVWEMATGHKHGFAQENAAGKRQEGAAEFTTRMHDRVGRWLVEDVFPSEV